MPDPFSFLAIDKDLACTFFAVFSRFEFALKDSGYIFDARGRGAPDWKAFGDACTLNLNADNPVTVSLGYLLAYPPQVQNPKLQWEDRPLPKGSDAVKAIESVQRVRNNLFHGGKHPPFSTPSRDQQLVEASLALLHELLVQNDDLMTSYETVVF